MRLRRGRRRFALAITVAISAIVVMVVAMWSVLSGPAQRQLFSPEDWRRADESERLPMAEDLLNSGFLTGRTRESVQQVLGPPDWTPPNRRSYVYDMVYEHHLVFKEPRLLYVDFDWETGRVNDVHIGD